MLNVAKHGTVKLVFSPGALSHYLYWVRGELVEGHPENEVGT